MDTESLLKSLNANNEEKTGNTPCDFVGLDDLIRMKEAADRSKDLEDLRVLKKLKNEK